jgi:hypothetical protein
MAADSKQKAIDALKAAGIPQDQWPAALRDPSEQPAVYGPQPQPRDVVGDVVNRTNAMIQPDPWYARGLGGGTVGDGVVTLPVGDTLNTTTKQQAAAQEVMGPPVPAQQPQANPQANQFGSAITNEEAARAGTLLDPNKIGKPKIVERDGKMVYEFSGEQLAYLTQRINENAIKNPQFNAYTNPNVDFTQIGLDRPRAPFNMSYGQVDPNTGQPKQITLADLAIKR